MTPPYEELFDASIAFEHKDIIQNTLAELPACKGILLFVDPDNHPIQLLQAANLRRTARTKLFRRDEGISKRTNISELTNKIFWLCCYNNFMTQTTYVRLAHVLFEKQTDKWLQLPRPCFSVIETDSWLPYFDVSSNPAMSEKRIVYGLFPSRKAAAAFSKALNSVFCLCQNPTLLKTPSQSSCPYLQMMKCPKPCLDPAQRKSYASRVDKAITVANGDMAPSLNALGQRMNEAANAMDFEKAAELKKQIDQLENLKKPDYRWVHNLKNLSVLHMDRTFKKSIKGQRQRIQQYQWLRVDSETISDLGIFSPTSRQEIDRFLEKNWTGGTILPSGGRRGKHLANLAFFLFRSKTSGLWLDCSDGIIADQLYTEVENLLGEKLPAYSAKNEDAE